MPLYTPPADKATLNNYYHRVGSGGGVGTAENRYYLVNRGSDTGTLGTATLAAAASRRHAMPFYNARACTLAELYMYQQAVSTGNVKISLYSNISDTGLYPNALLWESAATAATAVGPLSFSPAYSLAADTLYWVDVVFNAATTVYASTATTAWAIFGFPSGTGGAGAQSPGIGLYGTATTGNIYSATSPATYPADSSISTGSQPMVLARYSS